MSLEELLKDPEGQPGWKKQRQKLLRVLAGLLIAAVAVTAGAYYVSTLKRSPQVTKPAPAEADPASLAALMRLQNETKELKRDLKNRYRRPATAASYRGAGEARKPIVNYDPGEGFAPLTGANAEVYIPTGAVFQAELLTPIKTSVEKTFVMAETTSDFRMDAKRRIPRGSRLIGRSHFDPLLKGVVVEFSTIVFPHGIESSLNALALSRNALPEIEGLYFSDRMTNYGTALAFGFLSGFAGGAREGQYTLVGYQPDVSLSNQVLTGLSAASFQVANQIMSDIRSSALEYVVVPAGEEVFVVLTQKYVVAQGGPK
jgi:hypothetical protein